MRFAIQLCLFGCIYASMVQCAVANNYRQAGQALLEGEPSFARKVIQSSNCKEAPECIELSVLYQIYNENSDAAIAQLNAYQTAFDHDHGAHAFAAEAWRSIGHKVNIFRKRTYYNKALAAKFRAGLGDSALPRYKVLRASAFGQDGNIVAQREITSKIVSTDAKWGLIAQINLAQNTDDFESGLMIAAEGISTYPNDFFINERIAQLYWTIGHVAKAQQHFLSACNSTPEPDWFDRKKWLDACTLTAQFAEQEELNLEAGIAALQRIFEEHRLLTFDNLEYAKLWLKLADKGEKSAPLEFLRRIIRVSDDDALVGAAKKVLKPYECDRMVSYYFS